MSTRTVGALVSKAAFARLCAVAKSSIGKALESGRLVSDEDGRIPVTYVLNVAYRDEVLENKVFEMQQTGEILPGWAAFCAIVGDKPVALIYYPPAPLFEGEMLQTAAAEAFQLDIVDLDKSPNVRDRNGSEYRIAIVTNSEKPAPWITDAEAQN